MKKAFSLIEIMQTVILLGIIAGLSISFFKKIDSNERLFISTEKKLRGVINEVNKQMCSDATPVCQYDVGGQRLIFRFEDLNDAAIFSADPLINDAWNCAVVYAGSRFDSETGKCIVDSPPGGVCPPITEGGNYGPGVTRVDNLEPMVKLEDGKCYADPPCPHVQSIDNTDRANQSRVLSYVAVPLSSVACPYDIPDYSSEMTVSSSEHYSVFCIKLHDLIPHKMQGNSDADDLRETCDSFTAFQTPLNAQNNENGVKNYVKNVISTNDSDPNLDKYNMRLPNGVILYNINGTINRASDRTGENFNGAKNIFIKYDRIGSAKTAVYGTNMKAFRVYNPLLETTDSSTGNPILAERPIPENDLPGTVYNDNCAACTDSDCSASCGILDGEKIKNQAGGTFSESFSSPEETEPDTD